MFRSSHEKPFLCNEYQRYNNSYSHRKQLENLHSGMMVSKKYDPKTKGIKKQIAESVRMLIKYFCFS